MGYLMNNNLIITEFLINNNEKSLMIRLKRGLLRWLASTNHKEIGTFEFIFGLFSGFVGILFRIIIVLLDKRSNNSCLIFYFKGSIVIFIIAYRLTIIIAITYFFLAPFLIGGFGN